MGETVSNRTDALCTVAMHRPTANDGTVGFEMPPSDYCLGNVQVSLGPTRVLTCVTATLVTPFQDRPTEGSLQFLVELSPMGNPAWEGGRSPEEGSELTR